MSNLFEHCRAGVSKTESKIGKVECRSNLFDYAGTKGSISYEKAPRGGGFRLNFFRPFLASAIRAGSIALGLTKWFVFNSRFLAMAKLAQARLCPFGLAKTLGCRSNKWVEKRSGRAARPSDQRFMRWFIRRVSFF